MAIEKLIRISKYLTNTDTKIPYNFKNFLADDVVIIDISHKKEYRGDKELKIYHTKWNPSRITIKDIREQGDGSILVEYDIKIYILSFHKKAKFELDDNTFLIKKITLVNKQT